MNIMTTEELISQVKLLKEIEVADFIERLKEFIDEQSDYPHLTILTKKGIEDYDRMLENLTEENERSQNFIERYQDKLDKIKALC